ncbi:hypothetical protein V5279_38100 [Bradyrhizobium sp. 26S5]|uniref:hypothetical protein n=1 Tax=Bradyrhizobium sp. 26S5 TaxID=3139729 RepID=UPI0030CA9CD4
MKRIVIVAALLMSAAVQAHADQLTVRWYDTIRPHGHKRPNAVGMAAVSACNQRLGEPDQGYIPEAFKDCMRGFGYRFMSDTLKRSERPATVYNRDSRDPSVGWHTENGMRVCHNDCDNPEIPGSGAVCRNVNVMGTTMRECVTGSSL